MDVTTKRLSPGQELKLQRDMERLNHAFAALSQSLMRGEVVGDDVLRLHKAITESAGDAGKLGTVETELSLRHFLALNNRVAMDAVRHIGR